MELTVTFAKQPPTWQAVTARLMAAGVPVSIRMIDGLPAFPDEQPAEDWSELRFSTPSGMLTLRRRQMDFAIVSWGNADAALVRHWQIVAWACAAAGDGRVATSTGSESAEDYLRSAKLFET